MDQGISEGPELKIVSSTLEGPNSNAAPKDTDHDFPGILDVKGA